MKKDGEKMSKKSRNVTIIVIILVILGAFYVLKNVGENRNQLKIISGLVIEKNKTGSSHFITVETFGENENEIEKLVMKVENESQWKAIEKDDYYFMTYTVKDNSSLVLKEIEKNDTFKTIYESIVKEEPEEEEETEEEVREKFTAIFPSSDKLDISQLTLLDRENIDFNGDGKIETISMFTTAQRDENGEMMWDDGQKWFLLINDEDNEYVLFDDYVQLGMLEFWVFTSKDEYHIMTLQTGSAVLKLSDYTFDYEKGSFVKKDIFNPEFLNVIYNSTIK
ncbi:hypothetical protein [Anaerosalibacter sp. Marseille-P3206]|uniref:hypothetical protein n=1 Tax=Anaerosalibacter sp. Marseille-P3206 TaxID=1871005 RepID=UPI0013565AF9|nr:hypothetical protein [Anaerosalibacter sp. Marseille-P3206]